MLKSVYWNHSQGEAQIPRLEQRSTAADRLAPTFNQRDQEARDWQLFSRTLRNKGAKDWHFFSGSIPRTDLPRSMLSKFSSDCFVIYLQFDHQHAIQRFFPCPA